MLQLASLAAVLLAAAEPFPPQPREWVNDHAQILDAETRRNINRQLEAYEQETSIHIVVVTWPSLPEQAEIADWTMRAIESWPRGVGQDDYDNGLVLFVFPESRKIFIQVGYGLEGAVPDALAKRIIEDEILPHFRGGNFGAGIAAGVEALMAATRGEYQPREKKEREGIAWPALFFVLVVLIVFINHFKRRGGRYYDRRGPHPYGGRGWSSGGGGWSSGGGGFAGGGGGFGGGGAGGSW